MTVDAVLFDLDDTLYPYAPCNDAGKRAARATANELGYGFNYEEFETFYQRGRRDVKRDLTGTAASHDRLLYFKRALDRYVGEPRPGHALALADAFWDGYLEAMDLFPAVETTLEELREADVAVAIVTNLTTRIQLRKLERLGLAERIDLLVTSEEVGQEKPASVMFTYPLAQLECHPSDAMMVGDSIASDVVGANALGIETVLFNASDGDGDAGPASYRVPDHSIDTFGEIIEVVR